MRPSRLYTSHTAAWLLAALALIACGDTSPQGDESSADASGESAPVDGSGASDGPSSDDAGSMDAQRACGAPGQSCCPGETCSSGGCCVAGPSGSTCVAAGGTCRFGLGTCSDGSCGQCGGLGRPCCLEDGYRGCTAPATTCSNIAADATSATCVACGGDGQLCCDYGAKTCFGAYMACVPSDAGNAYSCTSQCGHPGEPCCSPTLCRDGGCCMNSGTVNPYLCVMSPTCGCVAGSCTTCGATGLPCCDNMTCAANQGMCLPPSGAGGANLCGFRQGP